MSDLIRVGCVSKINYEEGTIEVTYPDRDDAVTDPFPVLSFNDEYKMPDIGQDVLVLHLSNGSALGIVLGPYWIKDNKPAVSGKDVYRRTAGPCSSAHLFFRSHHSGAASGNEEQGR